jgi:hypothetical protein
MERIVTNRMILQQILAEVTFAPSCLNMGWGWEVENVYSPPTGDLPGERKGWLVNTTFRRPDTNTGEMGTGRGRQEFIARGTSESGVVKTAWLLAELIVRHELMEAFLYKGVRIFNPHNTVEELSAPALRK